MHITDQSSALHSAPTSSDRYRRLLAICPFAKAAGGTYPVIRLCPSYTVTITIGHASLFQW